MRFQRFLLFLFVVFMFIPTNFFAGWSSYKVVGAVLALSTLATAGVAHRRTAVTTPQFLGLVVVLAAGTIGALQYGRVDYQSVAKMGMDIVLFVVVAQVVHRPRDLKLVLVAFVVGGTVSVASGLLEIGGLTSPGDRVAGILGNANGYGQACTWVAFCLLGLSGVVRTRIRRVVLLALIVPCIVGLLYSQSRGATVAFVVTGLAAVLVLKMTRRAGMMLIASAAVVVYLMAPAGYGARWRQAYDVKKKGRQSGLERRVDLNRAGMEVFKRRPVFGAGLGNQRLELEDSGAARVQVTHNAFAQLLAETGLVGSLPFLAVFFATGRWFFRVQKLPRLEPTTRRLAATFFLLFVAVTVGEMASGNFDHPIWFILFAIGMKVRDLPDVRGALMAAGFSLPARVRGTVAVPGRMRLA